MEKQTLIIRAMGALTSLMLATTIPSFATADDLTIDESTNITESCSYNYVNINATLSLLAGKTVTMTLTPGSDGFGALRLPGDGGTFGELIVSNKSGLAWSSDPWHMFTYVGQYGGWGRVVIYDAEPTLMGVCLKPNASGATDELYEVLRLEGTSAWTRCFEFKNQKPASTMRLSFAGGLLMPHANATAAQFFNADASGAIIDIHSEDGNPIRISADNWDNGTGKSFKFFNSNYGGTGQTSGSGDVRLCSVNDLHQGYVFLLNTDPDYFTWGHAGNTVLTNGVQVKVSCTNALPATAGTGVLVMESSKPASATYAPHLDMNGYPSAVNGLVVTATNAVIENSSESRAELVFGSRGEDSMLVGATIPDDILVTKSGAGTLSVTNADLAKVSVSAGVLAAADSSFGDITVSGGQFKVMPSSDGTSDKWWRLTILKATSESDQATDTLGGGGTRQLAVTMGPFHLFDADGNRVDDRDAVLVDDASALEANQAACSHEVLINGTEHKWCGNFDVGWNAFMPIDDTWRTTLIAGSVIDPDDESTWVTITYRLKDDANPVVGYKLGRSYSNVVPYSWRIESSADGVNWTLLDEHEEASEASSVGTYSYYVSTAYTSDLFSDAGFCPTGVVSVGTGATLDLSAVKDVSNEIASLEIDCAAGAGTITTFRPAENGIISLLGRSSIAFDGTTSVLPITVGSVVDEDRLSNWTVQVDGETKSTWGLCLDAQGRLCVCRPSGITVLFR